VYVFESHPIQSTLRVLFQLDAPRAAIQQFWSDLQDGLALVQPRLVYFAESDPLHAVKGIARQRGAAWESYLVDALRQSPWAQARGLSGGDGVERWIVEYGDLVARSARSWRYPMLTLPARPENYERRTEALITWAMGFK
jgi:hypothetical protein